MIVMDLVKVRLRKDKNYVYCYLREDIILDENCDCYEQRTYRRSSYAGYSYAGEAGSILNSCDDCLREAEQYEEFLLPEKASKIYKLKHGENKSNIFGKIKRWL